MKTAALLVTLLLAAASLLAAQALPEGHPPVLPPNHPQIGPAAAPPVPADAADVATADAAIAAYYATISGPPGEARDWDRFRSLFMPSARLVATRPGEPDAPPVSMTVEQFVALNGKYFESAGYFEQEIHRNTDSFGHIVQAFSTYASRKGDPEAAPYSRGVNAIQLISSGGRWWIVSILWDRERPDAPLGAEHLPG